MFDLLIKGARILDGTGHDPFTADIGVTADAITAVGDLSAASSRTTLEFAAPPRIVSPGFIDAHSHSDTYLLIEPSSPSKLFQGVTTEICGNCGASAAPISSLEQLPSDWSDKTYPGSWSSLAEYRALLERVRPAVNVAMLVGHNTLRRQVAGYDDRPAGPDELARMIRLLEESLDAGARGLSTGLIYAPGMYAPPEELAALAAVVGRRGGVYGSHMRSEGERLIEAIDEAIAIGRESGARVEISHLKVAHRRNWSKVDDALAHIQAARERGEPVAADRYPYTSGATELDVVFPAWAAAGGRGAVLARLADAAARGRLRRELIDSRPREDWEGVVVGSTADSDNARFRGRNLLEVSEALGVAHPVDAVLHLCETDRLTTGAFFGGMSEANMRRILCEPYVMLGTDASLRAPSGPLGRDYPHPRTYGSFPRFLRMVLDENLLSLPEAVRKLTALPAGQFGLADRGVIAEGKKADLVIFDAARVRDTATYADPHRFAEGVDYVVVNGVVTAADGKLTGAGAGRFL